MVVCYKLKLKKRGAGMQRKKGWLLLMMVIMLVGVFTPASQEKASAARVTTYTAHVSKIVDGDTIHLQEDIQGSHKVRLLNIDTPETHFNGHSQEPWGSNATNFLSTLIKPGDEITVITDKVALDQYGRLLAHIKKGTLDINETLLKEGYATMYYIYPNMLYYRTYQSALLSAMKEKKGIWNPENPLLEEPFEFRNRIRTGKKGTDKYVGDFLTKKYVDPIEYEQISTQNRVFFWTEKEAQEAGFTKMEKKAKAS